MLCFALNSVYGLTRVSASEVHMKTFWQFFVLSGDEQNFYASASKSWLLQP